MACVSCQLLEVWVSKWYPDGCVSLSDSWQMGGKVVLMVEGRPPVLTRFRGLWAAFWWWVGAAREMFKVRRGWSGKLDVGDGEREREREVIEERWGGV